MMMMMSTLDQTCGIMYHSYSTLGPVGAWMVDRLRTSKPPRRGTRHPDLLSLSPPFVGRL